MSVVKTESFCNWSGGKKCIQNICGKAIQKARGGYKLVDELKDI